MTGKGKAPETILDIQSHVLYSTLDAIADEAANPCVICLETVSEQATALPCLHSNFDFLCLASWVQEKSTCPLCKADISSIRYSDGDGKSRIYHCKNSNSQTSSLSEPCNASTARPFSPWAQELRASHPGRYPAPNRRKRPRPRSPPPSANQILLQRKRIYELDLYSLHVGSNRLSGYTDLTPTRFGNDPHLVSRARKWIRRELQVFDFLNREDRMHPETVSTSAVNASSRDGSSAEEITYGKRASSNAKFLLEYIIAILKTVDIKGSKGQAQEMLSEFLGARSALFLHELNAWLRSPYEELAVWDRHVRYEWPEGEAAADRERMRNGVVDKERSEESWKRRRRMVDRWVPD